MKSLILKYCITVILLMISSSVYSRSDTGHTYSTNDLSIIYNQTSGSNSKFKSVSGKEPSLLKSINDINVISFLNDSMISVSNNNQKDLKININTIVSLKIKKGSNAGIGIAIGGVSGMLLGFFLGYAAGPGSSAGEIMNVDGIYAMYGGLGGLLMGMGIGAGIGASVKVYKTIDLDKYKKDKRIMFESIFKAEKRRNNPDKW